MSSPAEIPFDELLRAMLDTETPFQPRYLYRLSDLEAAELRQLQAVWPQIPAWRRKALMEDIETLGESDTLLSFEALGRIVVNDSDAQVRLPAVRALWEYESPVLIPIFMRLMSGDEDAEVRAAAATGLGSFVYAGEVDEIPEKTRQELEDRLLAVANGADVALVRRRALESLGYSSRKEVDELIEQAFASGNKEWMASALFAMGRSANELWAPQVQSMLQSQLPILRMEAARAAGELEVHAAVPVLLDLMDDPDDDVRHASIWALSQLGGEGVAEALEQALNEADDDEESEFIEEALDNMAFAQGSPSFELFDYQDDDEYDEYEDELLNEDELFGLDEGDEDS